MAPVSAPQSTVPEWVHRAGHVLLEIAILVTAWLSALLGSIPAIERAKLTGGEGAPAAMAEVWAGLAMAVGLLAPLLLLLRNRSPWVAWILGGAQMLLPIGPQMMFALPAFLRRSSSRLAAAAITLHAVGIAVFFAIDSRGTNGDTSALRVLTASGGGDLDVESELSISSVVWLYLLTVLLPVVIGFILRYRDQLAESRRHLVSSQEDLAAKGASLGQMAEALTRKEEREMIAREIHDVIGHRLSMINVYAGGLELAVGSDPELAERARLVREASQQTVDDLRSLVQVMRDPEGFAGLRAPGPDSLTDVAGMIEEVLGAGRPVASSVFLDSPEQAPPVLSHAVYRILQELLTNTQKHAQGAPVRVRVTGGPGRGIRIEVANVMTSHRPAPPVDGAPTFQYGSRAAASTEPRPSHDGSGLTGVRERAAALEGTVHVEPGPPEFVVRVDLPWRTGADRSDRVGGGR
ncbi:MAG TPA: histidine kinase [Actinomycetaceae bacterium]|nr:histidine kinase [Actinomycetaceae bacterium]